MSHLPRSPFSAAAVRAAATRPVVSGADPDAPFAELRSYLFFLGLIATTFLF